MLSSILYLLLSVTILVILSKNLRLGSILGLLIAGIIVGPHSPGPILTDKVDSVRHITEFGVVLLLFVIGLEMQPKKLWKMKRDVFGLGSGQIIFSGLAISAYLLFYEGSWKGALLLGFTFALSSTAFVMQILQEKGEFNTPKGKSAFSILLMQDISIVPLLALVPLFSESSHLSIDSSMGFGVLLAIGFIGILIAFGKYIVPVGLNYLAKKQNREAFFFWVILSVVFAAWAMEFAGLSMALGTFIMGMMLSNSKYQYQIQAQVEPFKGVLMMLFFIAVGMSIDIEMVMEQPWFFLQHLMVIMAIKVIVLLSLMLFMGYNRRKAISISFLLAQSGEFGFVLLGSAKALGVISDELFVAGIAIISFSMLVTPLVSNIGDKLSLKIKDENNDTNGDSLEKLTYNHNSSSKCVIISGYGRVGRLIATMLEYSNISYVAFDFNKERVELGKKENRPVYFADLRDYSILSNIGLSTAKMLIVTVDNHHTASKIVSHGRNLYPSLPIYARTRDLRTKNSLLKYGASWAMPEMIEGSLSLGAEVLRNNGLSDEEVNETIQQFRKDSYYSATLELNKIQ